MFEEDWARSPPTSDQFSKAAKKVENKLKKELPLRPSDQPEMILGSVDLHGKVSLYEFAQAQTGIPNPCMTNQVTQFLEKDTSLVVLIYSLTSWDMSWQIVGDLNQMLWRPS
jgi:hypothetical protein